MTDSMRRKIAAIVGSCRATSKQRELAFELGRAAVDRGFKLVTGGLQGVMEEASRGGRAAARYTEGSIIGVLPSYDAGQANPWVDTVICTGIQHARNLIVVATGDVVFCVGGGAGTLSEIALAWQLGKPIIAVGISEDEGWASRLAGTVLDGRSTEKIFGPYEPTSAVEFALKLLSGSRPVPRSFP